LVKFVGVVCKTSAVIDVLFMADVNVTMPEVNNAPVSVVPEARELFTFAVILLPSKIQTAPVLFKVTL